MAASTKTKSSKNIGVISAVKAFEATLRAACRHKQVPVHRPLLEQLAQCQDASKPLTSVVLYDCPHGEVVAAVAECLASYGATRSLSCLGCSVGDKGLTAVAALLQASGSKWWHGCRLQSLAITNDSRHRTTGSRPASPALSTAPASQQCQEGHQGPGPSAVSNMRQPVAQRPSTAPAATTHQQRPGMKTFRPLPVFPAVPGYLQQAGPQRAQDDLRISSLQLREVHYKIKAPRTMMEVRTWALAPTLDAHGQQHKSASSSPTPGSPSAAASSSSRPGSPVGQCCFSTPSLQHLSLSLGVAGLQLQRLVLDHTALGDQGIGILATGLGCCSSLTLLSLRHCGIGPAGAQALAEALVPACKKHCSTSSATSSRMSLGSASMQLALPPTPAASGAASGAFTAVSGGEACSSSSGSSREPQLLELHLDGNPLGASGLHALSKAVRVMRSIKVLALAGIGLECDSSQAAELEVQVLAHSLLAGPNNLATLDFSDNHIGDACAVFFIGLLSAKASITLLKLTPRLSPSIMQQVSTLLEEHQRAAKVARAGGGAKKKKPA